MSPTTFSLTMEDLKSEEVQIPWQGYRNPLPMPPRLPSSYGIAPLAIPYHGVARSSYPPLNILHDISPRTTDGIAPASRPPLISHHSYPSLKRPYQTFEDSNYGEPVPELLYEGSGAQDAENAPKPTINPDHRLLSFSQSPERHTILDQYGRPGSMEIAAQIHGMFFLSEIATSSGENIIIQPELTCYRRNLFQISGSVAGPSGQLSVITDRGQAVPIVAQELSISATESVDGHVIRLIVIPWKTPPPNSPEVPPNVEQEPPPISLVNHAGSSQESSNEMTIHPIAWRRLQFRVATANNGRRKELQQHFVLRLTLTATLTNGTKVTIGEAATAPIVVRGRSPRNFQARKEIPLVGASASPRGQTAQSSPAEKKRSMAVPDKTRASKPQNLDPPKRNFQFDAINFPASPALLRQSYSHWNTSQQQSDQGTVTTTSTSTNMAPQVVLPNYVHSSQTDTDAPRLHAPSVLQPQPPVTEATMRPQFYHSAAAPSSNLSVQYIDSNSRPTKSPRNVGPPDHSSLPLYQPFEVRLQSAYTVSPHTNDQVQPSREYFHVPGSLPPETWTTAESGNGLHTTSMPPPAPGQHYAFPSEAYIKDEAQSTHYSWSAA